MRKYMVGLIAFAAFSGHGVAHAVDGEGTVEEIRVCSFGNDHRINYFFFRLSDGEWFGTWGPYDTSSSSDKSANTTVVSTVLTAYSSTNSVEVRATYATRTACGVTAEMLWKSDGDYIAMTRD